MMARSAGVSALMLFAVAFPRFDAYRVKRTQSKDASENHDFEAHENTITDGLEERSQPDESLEESNQLVLDKAVQTKGKPSPVHCHGSWHGWGQCSKNCGGGSQTRHYHVTRHPQHGGHGCPGAQSRPCNTNPCPLDCLGHWGNYGTCSQNCGGGSQTRLWQVTRPSAHGGNACPSPQSKPCNTLSCPIDCQGEWGGWSACSVTCGAGSQTREFKVSVQAQHGGKPCQNDVSEEKSCEADPCVDTDKNDGDDGVIDAPTDCEGHWEEWGACSKPCGGGTQARQYVVTTEAKSGGKACCVESGFVASQECNNQACQEKIIADK